MNKEYFVDFGTGAGNFYEKNLERAMRKADKEATYTQEDIVIYNYKGEVVASRKWIGIQYDDRWPEIKPIIFGDFGFYTDWA